METLIDRTRASKKSDPPKSKNPATPHKRRAKSPTDADEDTRILIEAIKGLKGLR